MNFKFNLSKNNILDIQIYRNNDLTGEKEPLLDNLNNYEMNIEFTNSYRMNGFYGQDEYDISSLPLKYITKFNVKERDKSIDLIIEETILKEENGEIFLEYNDRDDIIISYDKNNKEVTNKDILLYYVEHYRDHNIFQNSTFSRNNDLILDFLLRILKDKNEYLYNILINDLVRKKNRRKFSYNFIEIMNKVGMKNLFNMTFDKTEGFEKVMKINKSLILDNFNSEVLEINNKGKINKVLEIPKFVLEYINKNKYSNMLQHLQNINVEGNEFRVLFDFFDNSGVLVPANKREEVFTQFTAHLAEIYKYQNYKMKDLLSFLIRESYFNKYEMNSDASRLLFTFPIDEAALLKDYLSICYNNNLEMKKYPNTILDHDIVMKNISIKNHIAEEDFLNRVQEYKHLKDSFNHKEYIIVEPKNLDDMIKEGNALHHCVASYSFNIMDKDSYIFFLREKKDPNKPFVTIELNKKAELNHIRTMYNVEPEQDIINMIKKWCKRNKI